MEGIVPWHRLLGLGAEWYLANVLREVIHHALPVSLRWIQIENQIHLKSIERKPHHQISAAVPLDLIDISQSWIETSFSAIAVNGCLKCFDLLPNTLQRTPSFPSLACILPNSTHSSWLHCPYRVVHNSNQHFQIVLRHTCLWYSVESMIHIHTKETSTLRSGSCLHYRTPKLTKFPMTHANIVAPSTSEAMATISSNFDSLSVCNAVVQNQLLMPTFDDDSLRTLISSCEFQFNLDWCIQCVILWKNETS